MAGTGGGVAGVLAERDAREVEVDPVGQLRVASLGAEVVAHEERQETLVGQLVADVEGSDLLEPELADEVEHVAGSASTASARLAPSAALGPGDAGGQVREAPEPGRTGSEIGGARGSDPDSDGLAPGLQQRGDLSGRRPRGRQGGTGGGPLAGELGEDLVAGRAGTRLHGTSDSPDGVPNPRGRPGGAGPDPPTRGYPLLRGAPVLVLLAACAPEPVELIAADPGADGEDGRDGPLGAVLERRSVQVRVTERLRVDVVRPAEGQGPWPGVLFVQGGLVTPERYHWLGAHLATRGYAVAYPHHDLDLAITEVDDGVLALDALRDEDPDLFTDAPVAALGHSLGGVVAAWSWAGHDEIGALGLLASYPAGEGSIDDRPGTPVLAVAGTADGSALAADVRAGFDRFREPRLFAAIEGLTHYAWTDDPTDGERAKDGEPGRPLAELRADARRVVDAWLDEALLGAPVDHDFGPGVVEVVE